MYKRILVPVDGSPASDCGLKEGIQLAKDQGAELRLLHVLHDWLMVSPDSAGTNTAELEEQMRKDGDALLNAADRRARKAGVTPTTLLLDEIGAPVGAAILSHARDWHADLIVCGTHGRHGVRRLVLGSDAEYIVRHAHVPVLLRRHVEKEERK